MNTGYEIIEGLEHTDFDQVQRWLTTSYWAPGIAKETIIHAAKNSALVLNAFAPDKQQIGFGRIVSDKTRFAYLSDFFVDEQHRGKGLAQALVRYALNHPDFATVRNWCLMTLDAHGVYEKLGFKAITDPACLTERWMARIERKN
ncbi:MAG TPA: GNAT family N-acetyltransferase [Planctomycetota bacterium]|nr:GNAT family N-acetyltransferase [Planctomycetota bacterium]